MFFCPYFPASAICSSVCLPRPIGFKSVDSTVHILYLYLGNHKFDCIVFLSFICLALSVRLVWRPWRMRLGPYSARLCRSSHRGWCRTLLVKSVYTPLCPRHHSPREEKRKDSIKTKTLYFRECRYFDLVVSQWLLAYYYGQPPCTLGLTSAVVCTWMGDLSSTSIFADSPSDETLNRGMNFPLGLI